MINLAVFTSLLSPGFLFCVWFLSRALTVERLRRTKQGLALASYVGVLSALLISFFCALNGPVSTPLLGVYSLGFSLRFDGLSCAIFLMVSLLVMSIGSFSKTYLDGDHRHAQFLGLIAGTVASVELLVLSGNLFVFWGSWVLTSLFLHRLLMFYPERPRAILAARKKFLVARCGDATLAMAFALLWMQFGTGELSEILGKEGVSIRPSTSMIMWASCFLAITAIFKSAQFPTHGWLIEVMETPTPVSALLHAGILNAGPFLVLRFSPIIQMSAEASVLLMFFGGVTAIFASISLRTQSAVKTALGYSSSAHMGFMLFVCGLGVFPAAALHLIAHSFYKAHAFLSAGGTVKEVEASRLKIPPRLLSPSRGFLAFTLSSTTYFSVASFLDLTPWNESALLMVGSILILGLTQLVGAGIDTSAGLKVYSQVIAFAGGVTFAFFALEELTRLILQDSLPAIRPLSPGAMMMGLIIVLLFAMVVLFQLLGWGRNTELAQSLRVHFRNGFYANAVFDRLVCWLWSMPQKRIWSNQ